MAAVSQEEYLEIVHLPGQFGMTHLSTKTLLAVLVTRHMVLLAWVEMINQAEGTNPMIMPKENSFAVMPWQKAQDEVTKTFYCNHAVAGIILKVLIVLALMSTMMIFSKIINCMRWCRKGCKKTDKKEETAKTTTAEKKETTTVEESDLCEIWIVPSGECFHWQRNCNQLTRKGVSQPRARRECLFCMRPDKLKAKKD